MGENIFFQHKKYIAALREAEKLLNIRRYNIPEL